MLLNPKALGKEQQLGGISNDPFDRPIPGQSLTGAPDTYPWEKPAQYTTVDEALAFIIEKLQSNPRTQKSYDQVIMMGMPIESITNTIAFGGFVEGLWSADIAELLKPPVMGFLMLYAQERDLSFVPYNNDKSSLKTSSDDMSAFDTFATTKENNPAAYTRISTALKEAGRQKIEQQVKDAELQDSFLVQGPEQMDANMEQMPVGIPTEETVPIPQQGSIEEEIV